MYVITRKLQMDLHRRCIAEKEENMYRILVCDDEKDIVSALEIYLKSEGYEVVSAYNGKEALEKLSKNDIHLVLLDFMMPVMDGMNTIAEIRKNSNVPVIFLTAKSEDTDKILGLNIGADDYVTKPFNPVELLARVRSQLRRYMQLGVRQEISEETRDYESILSAGPVTIRDASKEAFLDGELLALTKTEYDILKLFVERPGVVFSPKEIYTKVWDEISIGNESTVAVHIRHLREKIEIDPANPRWLKVVWGRGYKLDVS